MKTAHVDKPHTDESRDIWFWRQGQGDGQVQCSSHATQFTPYWCRKCKFAQDSPECFRGHGALERAEVSGQLALSFGVANG